MYTSASLFCYIPALVRITDRRSGRAYRTLSARPFLRPTPRGLAVLDVQTWRVRVLADYRVRTLSPRRLVRLWADSEQSSRNPAVEPVEAMYKRAYALLGDAAGDPEPIEVEPAYWGGVPKPGFRP